MARQRGQKAARLGMVGSGLGTTEGMGKCIQPVDGTGDKALVLRGQGLGAVVYAADGGNDPKFVADAYAPVRPAVTLECFGRHGGQGSHVRRIGVLLSLIHI